MRNIYQKLLMLLPLLTLQLNTAAQCGSPVSEGSATNMFTMIRNATNPVAVDKTLNTVVFVHRNNATAFGGNSGNLRYDFSTNGGSSWTLDQGVLNPINSNYGRYPNALIYNPTGNTTPASAYLGYLAATISSATSVFNGMVTGVRTLAGTGNTETYNQPSVIPNNVPGPVVKGAPGVYWSMDALLNASNFVTGFTIYKGVWNSSSHDVVWSTNFSATPAFNTAYSGVAYVGDYNIAFDPSGTYGWMSFLGHVTPGPSGYAYYPVLYKTTDGGNSWTGPIQADLNQFSCMTGNISAGNVISTNFEHDLAVDMYGNPHIFTTICNGTNAYSIYYTSWHHMYDITMIGGNWQAYDLGNVNAGRGTWGTGANVASMDMAPQVARSRDGSKLFFSWSDNTAYTAGAANQTPDLFSVGFDVVQHKFTGVKGFSSCNPAIAGKILFPHIAEEVLEPSLNTYKLAPMYGEYAVANDPGQTANFKFLDNATFLSSDFTISAPSAFVNINQGSSLLACPGVSMSVSINGNYSHVLWNSGNTTNINPITGPGTYSVVVSDGCNVGVDSISVSFLTFTPSVINPSVCPGGTSTLVVSGDANGYSWMPGNSSGTVAVFSPTANMVYTLLALGDAFCASTATLAVGVYTPPVISISGNTAVCLGSVLTQTVSGASTYSWASGENTSVVSFTPTMASSYTVFGFDAHNCSDTATVSIVIHATPSVSANTTESVICAGHSVTLTAHGATSYSWDNGATTITLAISPTTTTTYSVTGSNSYSCQNTFAFTQSVSACVGIEALQAEHISLQVYPNPTSGKFQLVAENTDHADVIEVYNSTGQKIMQVKAKELAQELDLSGQATGIYFIDISRNGRHIGTSKIIKE